MEVMNQLIIASDLQYLTPKQLKEFRSDIELTSYMLLKIRDSRIKKRLMGEKVDRVLGFIGLIKFLRY